MDIAPPLCTLLGMLPIKVIPLLKLPREGNLLGILRLCVGGGRVSDAARDVLIFLGGTKYHPCGLTHLRSSLGCRRERTPMPGPSTVPPR